jgi:ribose/xylose/arabinose/galactoside ABC-type transport system permease subunit
MRLFPDREKLKSFMKKGLPVVFTVVWAPMIWMLLASLFGPLANRLFTVWQIPAIIIAVATLAVTVSLALWLSQLSLKKFGDNG